MYSQAILDSLLQSADYFARSSASPRGQLPGGFARPNRGLEASVHVESQRVERYISLHEERIIVHVQSSSFVLPLETNDSDVIVPQVLNS